MRMCIQYMGVEYITLLSVFQQFTVAPFTSNPIDISITANGSGRVRSVEASVVIKIHLPPIHDHALPASSS